MKQKTLITLAIASTLVLSLASCTESPDESTPIPTGASLEVVAGIRHIDEENADFVKEVQAVPGDVLMVEMEIKNTGSLMLDEIGVSATLPDGVSYVEGSTWLYNNSNPDGLEISDLTEWRSIGEYRPYDGESGSASIHYEVIVEDILTDGAASILNISNEAAGYIDGNLVTDTHVYYVAVNLQ